MAPKDALTKQELKDLAKAVHELGLQIEELRALRRDIAIVQANLAAQDWHDLYARLDVETLGPPSPRRYRARDLVRQHPSGRGILAVPQWQYLVDDDD